MKRFALMLALALPLLSGCGEKERAWDAAARPVITGVEVEKAALAEETLIHEAPGTVRARSIAMISSKVMGEVTSVRVREGDAVSKGAVLLTIDDSDIVQKERGAEAGLKEAEAGLLSARENLKLMEATWGRYKNLYEAKAISGQEFDTVSTRRSTAALEVERMEEAVKRARAGVNEARVYRGYATVEAPFTGVVTGKKVDPGSMAAPGMVLLTMEDTSAYTVEADVDERLLKGLRPGLSVEVKIDSIERAHKGVLTEVVPSINPVSRTFHVKASVKGAGLRSGLFARVFLPEGKRSVLTVPKNAVVSKGQLTGVYALDSTGVATYRLLRTGGSFNGRIEVLSGLSAGEEFIAKGAEKAVDGGVVKKAR